MMHMVFFNESPLIVFLNLIIITICYVCIANVFVRGASVEGGYRMTCI